MAVKREVDMAGVSKSMWLKGIYADAATMKKTARLERGERRKDITRKWNEGVKALTKENDRLQAENEATFRREIDEIDAMTAAQIGQGPPG